MVSLSLVYRQSRRGLAFRLDEVLTAAGMPGEDMLVLEVDIQPFAVGERVAGEC